MKKDRALFTFFTFLFFSLSGYSQITRDAEGNVSRYCYKDSTAATICVEIDYSRMSNYEFAPPLNAMRGIATAYTSFVELSDGVMIKYKAVVSISGYEFLIKSQIAQDDYNRTFGYQYANNPSLPLYLTKDIVVKMKDTASLEGIEEILRDYNGEVLENGMLRIYSLNNVFAFCEQLNATGQVAYCYPRFSTSADAYTLSYLPAGYPYGDGADKRNKETTFVYDESGNMTGRVITWAYTDEGETQARAKKKAIVSTDSMDNLMVENIVGENENSDIDPINYDKKQDKVGALNFNIYPNPTVGLLTVEVHAAPEENPVVLYVYDFNGKLIKQQPIKSNINQVDITNEKSGMYVLRIQHKDAVVDWKIIKN